MTKQTAVEWLASYIKGITDLNCDKIIEQAKQMEKEQMKEAHLIADHYPRGYEFDKWYNETYGGKDETL
jgi:hypothetical protein